MMIDVKNIIFEYPDKRALRDVSFTIKKGSITALVGPNGAGKTTLMRCIAALEEPFSGNIKVGGADALDDPREVHRKIGYLSDFFGIYDDLTVRQCLHYMSLLHDIPAAKIEERIVTVTTDLQLSAYLDKPAKALSRGLRQRVGIAQAMVHQPEMLLLDEPASGLDPEARLGLSNLFKKLQEQGMTLLISSHILSELEDYCTDMLLLRDGEIITHAQEEEVSPVVSENRVLIHFTTAAENYLKPVEALADISAAKASGNTIECSIAGDDNALSQCLKTLLTQGLPVCGFVKQTKKLQDIYMDYADGGISHDA